MILSTCFILGSTADQFAVGNGYKYEKRKEI